MERLRWFTEEKLKKRAEIQERYSTMEFLANEERLKQLRLLDRDRMQSAECRIHH
jgi:hypothetical protein